MESKQSVQFAATFQVVQLVGAADVIVVDEDLRDGQAAARPLDHLPLASEVDIDKTRTANAKAPSKTSGGTLSVGGGMANYKPTKAGGSSPAPAKSVKVYSATWCRYCTELKKFLAENGISASVTEVDTLPEAAQQKAHAEMKRLTGKTSFPTVVVGNSAMAGFSPKWILQTLEN